MVLSLSLETYKNLVGLHKIGKTSFLCGGSPDALPAYRIDLHISETLTLIFCTPILALHHHE